MSKGVQAHHVGSGREGAEAARSGPVFLPATDILETEQGLVLLADMPGVDPATIDVSLDRNVLRIAARSKVSGPSGHSAIHAEYRTGDYERSFTVSPDLDLDRIEATVRDGVLRLVLPRVERAPTRKISVKVG